MSDSLKYRPEIDGLRAIAIIPVLLFHAKIGCPGGFVGVDVFFVISGFLITSLILKEMKKGTYSLAHFWERRLRRIVPALMFMILVSSVIGWFILLPNDYKRFGQSVVAQGFLVSNVYFWRNTGYFFPGSESTPLLHTWSLAVEEQFYVVFPIFLYLVMRYFSKHSFAVLIGICLASFIISIYGSYYHAIASFYLLPTRAWELLVGSILAFLPERKNHHILIDELWSWVGLGAILYAIALFSYRTIFPGVAAAIPCVGTALIIRSNSPKLTSLGRLLSFPLVVFVGLISYSLYLWHWPVLVYSQYWVTKSVSLPEKGILILLIFLVAIVSWRYVEVPFRKPAVTPFKSKVYTYSICGNLVLILLGLIVVQYDGFSSRYPDKAIAFARGATDKEYTTVVTLSAAKKGNYIRLGSDDIHIPAGVLVWGDSHAMSILPVINQLCVDNQMRGEAAVRNTTAPLVNYLHETSGTHRQDSLVFNSIVLNHIKKKQIANVLLVANWNIYLDREPDHFAVCFLETVKELREKGVNLWIMKSVPAQLGDVPKELVRAVISGTDPAQLGIPVTNHLQRTANMLPMLNEAEKLGARILDPCDCLVDQNGKCRMETNGKSLYYDSGHLSGYGSMQLKPLFEPLFRQTNNNKNR